MYCLFRVVVACALPRQLAMFGNIMSDSSAPHGAIPVAPETQKAAPRLDMEVAKGFIKAVLPAFDYIIGEIEKDEGWVRIPREVVDIARKLNISNWPEVLLDEARFRSMQLRLFSLAPTEMLAELFLDGSEPNATIGGIDFNAFSTLDGDARTRAVVTELDRVASEQQSTFLNVFYGHLTEAVNTPLEELPAEEIETEKRRVEALDQKAKAIEIQKLQIAGIAFVTSLFNYLALATHGQKLTTLVQRAIGGDDAAFLMAVQVDKTLLTHLPQFRERYWRAVLEGDANFLEYLSYRIRNPTLRGRNRYHTLWLVFVILDDLSLLDRELTNEAILDLYKAIPEDHVCKPIDDVDYVRKQRAAYLRLKRQTK